MNSIPNTLYKYRPINLHTLRIISHSQLYFPLSNEFNDPFDSKIIPDLKFNNEEELEKFLRDVTSANPDVDSQSLKERWYSIELEKFRASMHNDVHKFIQTLRLCCLSEKSDSTMMFSHYANGHRGICFEFMVKDDDFFDVLRPVIYPTVFPTINPSEMCPYKPISKERLWMVLEVQFLSKSPDWSYEKEWRILKADAESATYSFSEDALTAIIFGCKTTKEDKELIRAINQSRKTPAVLKEAYIIDKSFSIGIRNCIL